MPAFRIFPNMLEAVLKKSVSLVISAFLLYVPKEKVLQEMDALPTMEQRVVDMDLNGWTFERAPSERTGITHYYYHLASGAVNPVPLVLLHGFNTDGRVFLNVSELADSFELIAYNLPEESPYYAGHLSDFSVILDDFFETIFLDTVIIAGNSVGGGIALHYCASDPGIHVKKLILLSTTVFGSTQEDRRRFRGMADKLLPYPDYKLFYLLQKGQSMLTRFERLTIGSDESPSALVVTKRIAWYRQVLESLYTYDGRADARRIACPVLAMHGTADRVISADAAAAIPEHITHARLVQVEGAGHSLVHSHAAAVSAEILDFKHMRMAQKQP
ncbi:MAG: alpha/beta fold hydrolase [Chitinivibrionales bacterium]|nr:alpha/beta fold hydrolase [Chitinivibrionales bacterium]MBD3396931.1 alpha/beta fold hydrolase [Chitinivibrionales bacterium]